MYLPYWFLKMAINNWPPFCTCRFYVKSSFLNFSNDSWLNEFARKKVVRGDSTAPKHGTRSKKVWEALNESNKSMHQQLTHSMLINRMQLDGTVDSWYLVFSLYGVNSIWVNFLSAKQRWLFDRTMEVFYTLQPLKRFRSLFLRWKQFALKPEKTVTKAMQQRRQFPCVIVDCSGSAWGHQPENIMIIFNSTIVFKACYYYSEIPSFSNVT